MYHVLLNSLSKRSDLSKHCFLIVNFSKELRLKKIHTFVALDLRQYKSCDNQGVNIE